MQLHSGAGSDPFIQLITATWTNLISQDQARTREPTHTGNTETEREGENGENRGGRERAKHRKNGGETGR